MALVRKQIKISEKYKYYSTTKRNDKPTGDESKLSNS
jgi:hypothetical protein